MEDGVTFSRVQFRNFKALPDFSMTLSDFNVLVGPNNSGKSTIVSAFRVLAAGLRRARARKPSLLDGPEGLARGYPVSTELLPMSTENVHTDYDDTKRTTVTFSLSNGARLLLDFAPDGACSLFASTRSGRAPDSPSSFRREFPVVVGTVPVLGPVEHEEPLVGEEVVRRNLATHRASRNFRSFWYHNPELFQEFRALIIDSWPGSDVKPPEVMPPNIFMFCPEGKVRIDRELYWAGFGFQIWLQILTHVVRERRSTILVIDEPETYLHPDLQRHLVAILREAGPAIVMATHSGEIITEADPSEILLVDKRAKSAKRVGTGPSGVQAALQSIGARPNVAITRLARTRRALYVEDGEDFKVLRRFAGRMRLRRLAGTADITDIPLGGARPRDAELIAQGIEAAIGESVISGIVLDRDYRCDEELTEINGRLKKAGFRIVHTHSRKEIENYALVPRAIARAVADVGVGKKSAVSESGIEEILSRVIEDLRLDASTQYIAKRRQFLRQAGSREDDATIDAVTLRWFESNWKDPDGRLRLAPGKQVLKRLNDELQARFKASVTVLGIIEEMRSDEIPDDLADLLRELDRFLVRRH